MSDIDGTGPGTGGEHADRTPEKEPGTPPTLTPFQSELKQGEYQHEP